MKIEGFSYLRCSGLGQVDKDSFPRQREVIGGYAKRNGIVIKQEFVEKGVSGKKDTFDRPALTNLFAALKANGCKLVIVENATRLARDLMISLVILAEFVKMGVKVISAECGTDLTVEDNEPTKILIRQILGAVSQWQKCCDVQKLRVARMRIRREKGKCEGRKAYGHTDEERAVIQSMIEYRKNGLTIAQVVNLLNNNAVPTRKPIRNGKATKWHASLVQKILSRQEVPSYLVASGSSCNT